MCFVLHAGWLLYGTGGSGPYAGYRGSDLSALTRLTQLHLADTVGLSMTGVRDFPVLKQLGLSRCENVTTATLQPALESCMALEALTLDSCHMLTALQLTMPRLQVRCRH